jgi:hypothetical protein
MYFNFEVIKIINMLIFRNRVALLLKFPKCVERVETVYLKVMVYTNEIKWAYLRLKNVQFIFRP